MSVFGPPEAARTLQAIVAPLQDLGILGAVATRNRRLGGTDSTSFSQAGLPGIGISQDPIEYFTGTWHTNVDTYERILPEDAKAAACVVAATVYRLAMQEQMLPRFAPGDIPPPPGRDAAPVTTGGAPPPGP